MSNSGKLWDIKEVYKKEMNSSWSKGDIGVTTNTSGVTIEKIQISTTGNAAAFGDITTSGNQTGGAMAGNQTRLLFSGGNQPTTSNVICSKEFSFDGNFVDFGDLSVDRQLHAGASNGVRAAFAGGRQRPGPSGSFTTSNRMDVSTFASFGNAIDFGDLTVARYSLAAMQSPTRALYAGGSPSPSNTIDFVTWSSLGNATDFGDIGTTTTFAGFGGSSSETRGVFGGGGDSSNPSIINFITMASQGNSGDFGDLTVNRLTNSAAGNSHRVCFFGGQEQPSTNSSNVIDFVNIATRGNATDFGDMTSTSGFKISGHSNGHGGIGLGEFQRPSVTYMPGSGRAIICGGPPSPLIETFNITTLGNTVSFGSLILNAENWGGGCGNATRMLAADGGADSGYTTQIETIELASFGNALDFGDSTSARANQGSLSNSTRGVWGGGYDPDGSPAYSNVIDYVTIATSGNASDFGDLTTNGSAAGGTANSTRGLFGPRGPGSGIANVIDYITIGSTGNTTDFGDASVARSQCGMGASSTRALLGGGSSPSKQNVIDYVTIASTGNATDFGDLTVSANARFCTTNSTRAVWGGGYTGSPTQTNVLDFVAIASTGNAADFGDIASGARGNIMASSDSHGGLQSS
tara:strand:- start:174 stop:2075 length:1902 start_codon:yes stop_codon:yes gene_type:complete